MADPGSGLNYERIRYLLNPESLSSVRAVIVGLGSGGAPVCDHLTMNGIRNWHLYDPDTLDDVNLVKHPRMRKDVGRPKVDIQREWILDRNPLASVQTFCEDVMTSQAFLESVKGADIVLVCPDKKSVREFVSDQCVAYRVPFVTASVFRTGIGGEIYSYLPGKTGCYRCLQLFSLTHDLDLSDDALGLTDDEKERIYGLGEQEFRASGLSLDIQMISLIQARMALSILPHREQSRLPQLRANWIVFGNRPAKGVFRSHFEVKQLLLKPQAACNCMTAKTESGEGQ